MIVCNKNLALSHQLNVGPRFDTPSAAAQKQPAEQQDDLHYASISFSRNQTDAVYSNIQQVHLQREAKEDEEEDDEVEYTVVRYDSGSSAAGWAAPPHEHFHHYTSKK